MTPPLIPPQGGNAVGAREGGNLKEAEHYLNRAVAGLREAGQQDDLPRGLLARAALYRVQETFTAAWEDLNEAQEIAERGEMGLHLTDFHLEACRLALTEAGDRRQEAGKQKRQQAQEHLEKAAKMIAEMGYGRRTPEVEELRTSFAKAIE